MPLLIAALLALSAALVVAYPLLGLDREAALEAEGAAELSGDAERERSAKLALRDVTFDYRLGNLDENDYVALRDRYERRALAAMKTRYDREQALDELIDRQLDALRMQRSDDTSSAGANENGDGNGTVASRPARDLPGKIGSKTVASAGNEVARGAARTQTPRVRRRRGK